MIGVAWKCSRNYKRDMIDNNDNANDLESLQKGGLDEDIKALTSATGSLSPEMDLSNDETRAGLINDAFKDLTTGMGLSRVNPQELLHLRTVLTSETDRGCALMGAAYLDMQLGVLLKAYFVDDDKLIKHLLSDSGVLGTFSLRIDLAYALGLIAKSVERDLHLLRKIRNDFAHISSKISFNTESIASRCREFQSDGLPPEADGRRKCIRSIMGIASHIHSTLLSTQHVLVKTDPDYALTKKIYDEMISKLGVDRSPLE